MLLANITPVEFDFLHNFFKEKSGYHLTKDKEYLLISCLQPTMQQHQITCFSDLVNRLKNKTDIVLSTDIAQAMTINETMFFRDKNPFVQLEQNILPALAARTESNVISIWCAACSSGQEPYSVAMLLDSIKHKFPKKRFQIYATDISKEMVQRGKKGIYSDIEVRRSLSPEMQQTYFTRLDDTRWQISDTIRNMVTFETMNILEQRPSLQKSFDLVLCRNVLFYFDANDKSKALHNIRKTMRHPGYLMVGVSEILTRLTDEFRLHGEWRGVYETI